MLKIKSNRILINGEFVDGYLYINNGRIVCFSKDNIQTEEWYDFTGKYITPGFIELHSHGGGGYSFDGNAEDIINACNFHLRYGTTTILPTLMTAPIAILSRILKSVAEARESEKIKNRLYGAHLEGPYFSLSQCGGQPAGHISVPKKEEYRAIVDEWGTYIARWSYAPEKDKDGSFCKFITEHGIIASAGHTDAKYEDMQIAIQNGCNLVTHLYSCTSTVTREHGFRSLGVIETAYLRNELYVEIIADGKHLPPDLIKMIIQIKGVDKVALVTDSLHVAGVYPIDAKIECEDMIIEDGVCKLKDRSAFKGSIATANVLLKTLVKDCGIAIPDAVKMLTEVPAKILKVNDLGRLAEGCLGDVVAFDENFNVTDVFVGGKKYENL